LRFAGTSSWRPHGRNWLRFVILGASGPAPDLLRGSALIAGSRVFRFYDGSNTIDRVCFRPKRRGGGDWVELILRPPVGFVAAAVHLAMMHPAERHCELIAHLAAESAGLRKAKMMRVGGLPSADQAGLPGDEFEVFLVPVSARLTDGEHALVDPAR